MHCFNIHLQTPVNPGKLERENIPNLRCDNLDIHNLNKKSGLQVLRI